MVWTEGNGDALQVPVSSATKACYDRVEGTWEMTLRPPVIDAWDAVASRHDGGVCVAAGMPEVADAPIRSHGDAIRLLRMSDSVIRSVSLRQILREHTIREEMEDQ